MHKIVSTVILLLITFSVNAGDINKIFKDMPRDIVYGLNPELNQLLLDDPKDTTKFVSTLIYEKIDRKAINSNFISLKTSEAGMTDIKLLPLINDSRIICVVQTVCGSICDSKISFFTDKWELIDGSDLFPAEDVNWFIKADTDRNSEKYKHAIASLNMLPMKYTLSSDEAIISVDFDVKSFLSIEDYKNIEPFLTKESKVLKWDKVSFK